MESSISILYSMYNNNFLWVTVNHLKCEFFLITDSKDRKISKTQEKLMKLSQGQGQGQETPQNEAVLVSCQVSFQFDN